MNGILSALEHGVLVMDNTAIPRHLIFIINFH